MKKAAFITGLVGGIIYVLYNTMIFIGAVNDIDIAWVVALFGIAVPLSIVALVGACIVWKHGTVAGFMMLVPGVYNIVMMIVIMEMNRRIGDNTTLIGLLMMLFAIPVIVAGILAIVSRNQVWVKQTRIKATGVSPMPACGQPVMPQQPMMPQQPGWDNQYPFNSSKDAEQTGQVTTNQQPPAGH